MSSKTTPKFVVLTILDGWGVAPDGEGNAITKAKTPNMDIFWTSYPHTLLEASGQAVGLPTGKDGNTETGHLNIGAGRIVHQDLERINMSIAEGDFFINPVLLKAIEHVKQNNSSLHYMGLVGAGGVHSDLSHLFALVRLASEKNVKDLYIHVFTDGRDSPPKSAMTYVNKLQDFLDEKQTGKIASVMGRYWAMDRDMRWKRTEKAYKALTMGSDHKFNNIGQAIERSYADNTTDEFIEPAVITGNDGSVNLIGDNDAVVFFNFRIDRPRQLTKAFVMDDFSKSGSKQDFDPYRIKYEKTHRVQTEPTEKPFKRGRKLSNLFFVTMTEYSSMLVGEGAIPAFPPEIIENTLGQAVSEHDKYQLRITESEKERFVTFYFNGLQEQAFEKEDRIIVPSPNVATYDLRPEMSSRQLTDRLLNSLQNMKYKLIVVNYPNPDMVGHTGQLQPAIQAIESVDSCLGEIYDFVVVNDGAMLVTADHGNAEEIINLETGEINTEHSSNPVPFIAVYEKFRGVHHTLTSGILADIAPTVLALLDIPKPEDMSGRDLLRSLQ